MLQNIILVALSLAAGIYAGADGLARQDTLLLAVGTAIIAAASVAGGRLAYNATNRARRAKRNAA